MSVAGLVGAAGREPRQPAGMGQRFVRMMPHGRPFRCDVSEPEMGRPPVGHRDGRIRGHPLRILCVRHGPGSRRGVLEDGAVGRLRRCGVRRRPDGASRRSLCGPARGARDRGGGSGARVSWPGFLLDFDPTVARRRRLVAADRARPGHDLLRTGVCGHRSLVRFAGSCRHVGDHHRHRRPGRHRLHPVDGPTGGNGRMALDGRVDGRAASHRWGGNRRLRSAVTRRQSSGRRRARPVVPDGAAPARSPLRALHRRARC